uniref:Uncharacterized protein n=1 Tax=Rhizophora mucronata TaxID=61149 RepID=A0A2P2QBC5_RHIMU
MSSVALMHGHKVSFDCGKHCQDGQMLGNSVPVQY